MCSCKKGITKKKIKHELNKMEINKSPGNNDLTKEFYEAFLGSLLLSSKVAFLNKGTKYFSKTSCNKTYWKKGLQQKVYKKIGNLYLYLMSMLNWSQKYYQTESQTYCRIWFQIIKCICCK